MSLLLTSSNLTETHKHDDDLSVSLATNDGIEWFVDPGFHAYDETEPSRYAKSVEAHNSLYLPEHEYERGVHIDVRVEVKEERNGVSCISGKHHRYNGYVVSRTLYWHKSTEILFFD